MIDMIKIRVNRYILCNRGYKTKIDNKKDHVMIIKKKEEWIIKNLSKQWDLMRNLMLFQLKKSNLV